MYAEFKDTPAERSKGSKVLLAAQDRLLAWSSPTGLNLTACASQLMPVHILCVCENTCVQLHACVQLYAHEHGACSHKCR